MLFPRVGLRPTPVLLLVLVTPLLARPAAPADTNPFAAEEGFRQVVTLQAREQPVGEFLAGLGREHGLRVSADPTTQDERITVFCRARPVGEILAAVARHLDYTWVRKRGDGAHRYVLTQTPSQRREEERQRTEIDGRALADLRRQLAERLAQASLAPEERRQRRIESLQRQRDQQADPRLKEQLQQQIERLQRETRPPLLSGGMAAFETALLALSTSDWDQLWKGETVRFAYPPRAGRLPLREGQAMALAQTDTEQPSPFRSLSADGRPLEFGGVERATAELFLDRPGGSILRFRCRHVSRQGEQRIRRDLYEHLWGDPHPVEEPDEVFIDGADPQLCQRVRIPPAQIGSSAPSQGAEPAWLVDLLESLQPAVPFTLIGDSYEDGMAPPLPSPGEQRLDQWLKEWCPPAGVQVRRERTTLFFRHRDWAALRPLEVPDRVARPWEALLLRQRAFRLEDLRNLAIQLPEGQLLTMCARWDHRRILSPGERELLDFNLTSEWGANSNLPALRLLAVLTPTELSQLMQPRSTSLPLRRPDQQSLLRQWLRYPVSQDTPVGRDEKEAPGGPSLVALFDRELDGEDQLTRGAGRYFLRLEGNPGTFYLTRRTFTAPERDRGSVLKAEQAVNPRATERDLLSLLGTEWELSLLSPIPNEKPIAQFWFLTADTPQAASVRPIPRVTRGDEPTPAADR